MNCTVHGVAKSQTWLSHASALPLGGKAMTNLAIALKIRDITLLTKVRTVKAMVLLAVVYICENWTIKKLVLKN